MHLSLRQLKLFEAVARHLSFTRAAEELHLTQPAVSIQVKQLEGSVGLPLFEQIGKRIFLTEAGRELFDASQDIFGRIKTLEMVLADMKGLVKGRLDISVVTAAKYFSPHLLGAFLRLYPDVDVRLQVTNREQLLRRLSKNQDDLVIMGQVPDDIDVSAQPFLDNPLVIIAPPSHRLAQARGITLEQLTSEAFVVREPGSGTRKAMETLFGKLGTPLKVTMELGSTEAIKQAVIAGLGLSLVSRHNITLELATHSVCILDVVDFPIERQWFAVYPRGKKLSLVASTFLEFILQQSADIMHRTTQAVEQGVARAASQ